MAIAQIIITGSEILSGKIIEKNSYQILKSLTKIGFQIEKISIINDDCQRLKKELEDALSTADVIIISGGLGPTKDDITKETIIKYFSLRTYIDETVLNKIENYYKTQKRPLPEFAIRQALLPKKAIILENPIGFAPGLIIKRGKKIIILLPGVFEELKPILENNVIPFLEDSFDLKPLIYKTIRTVGISESEIMARIEEICRKRFKNIQISYLPSHLGVDIEISGKDKKELNLCEKEICASLKEYVYGYENISLEEKVGEILRKRNLTLATAESCSGGLLGSRITDVAGSSDYYIGGVVAYSNEIKKLICKVKEETLKEYGAVSKETAMEMAKGIKSYYQTDIGVSITGVAGPTSSEKKPVGLVYIGLAYSKKIIVEEHHFLGTRKMIKEQAVQMALNLLRKVLESE
ncbi:MAG: competence/damage-inducible protein A [candidate division WOR-3 bacterium]|nr:competence/damage-inducible protein A [candidate division WOR-3 bacterium]MCX7836815.1 competence/damage-inducible protein A [candidate division WOR-3 bacterium]